MLKESIQTLEIESETGTGVTVGVLHVQRFNKVIYCLLNLVKILTFSIYWQMIFGLYLGNISDLHRYQQANYKSFPLN